MVKSQCFMVKSQCFMVKSQCFMVKSQCFMVKSQCFMVKSQWMKYAAAASRSQAAAQCHDDGRQERGKGLSLSPKAGACSFMGFSNKWSSINGSHILLGTFIRKIHLLVLEPNK